jgi:hypothetical protein
METPGMSAPQEPKKSNTGLIIGVVVVVVLCCCCIAGVLLWQYGDAIMQSIS